MANLTIKDLPDHVHQSLKQAARSQGYSLNRYIISLLELSLEERNRRRLMRQGRGEFRQFLGTLSRLPDSTPLIREDRER
jgi:hypothetical protein